MVDVILLSKIANKPNINEKCKTNYVIKQECNSSIDSGKSNSTSSVNLIDSILLLNIDDGKNQKKYVLQQKIMQVSIIISQSL